MSEATDDDEEELDQENHEELLRSEMSIDVDEQLRSEMSVDEQLKSEMSIDASTEEIPPEILPETPPEIPPEIPSGNPSIQDVNEESPHDSLGISQLPEHILPSNEDILKYFKFKKQTKSRTFKTSLLSDEIAEELADIWKAFNIPTMELKFLKLNIQKLVQTGIKPISKKTQKRSSVQGFEKGPESLCMVSRCRCFLKALRKDDIGKSSIHILF